MKNTVALVACALMWGSVLTHAYLWHGGWTALIPAAVIITFLVAIR